MAYVVRHRRLGIVRTIYNSLPEALAVTGFNPADIDQTRSYFISNKRLKFTQQTLNLDKKARPINEP